MRTSSLLLGAAASATATAAITLDGLTLDWDYRAARLLPTTSDRCRAAFRAKIDCPDTLLNLAASMRPVFEPAPADFALTCSATCKASLDNYLGGLMLNCNAPGDLTEMHTDGPRPATWCPSSRSASGSWAGCCSTFWRGRVGWWMREIRRLPRVPSALAHNSPR